jgi:hypothetical protein
MKRMVAVAVVLSGLDFRNCIPSIHKGGAVEAGDLAVAAALTAVAAGDTQDQYSFRLLLVEDDDDDDDDGDQDQQLSSRIFIPHSTT